MIAAPLLSYSFDAILALKLSQITLVFIRDSFMYMHAFFYVDTSFVIGIAVCVTFARVTIESLKCFRHIVHLSLEMA